MAGPPFKVKAVYEYTSQEPDDLNFPLGQIITVTEEIDADWYEGEFTDVTGVKKAGIFPNNFVEKYEPEIPTRPSRPARPAKDDQSQAPASTSASNVAPVQQDASAASEEAPPTGLQPPPVASSATKPAAAVSGSEAPREQQVEPVPAPKSPQGDTSVSDSKKPPPIAPKSNAFKDRIAAFNQPAAAPILPFQPGQRSQPPSGFIRKPFVAPPPSKDAYVPGPKQEAVIKPYHRDEDPEILQRQEEDRAAAQAAGLSAEGGGGGGGEEEEQDEDAPKPQSLKDRIAMLQKQQAEQAQRRAEGGQKKEKRAPPPPKKTSQSSHPGAEDDDLDDDELRLQRTRSPEEHAESPINTVQQPRMASTQRHVPETAPSLPPVPQHEILSGGEEADHSAADETTDDAGTIGPEDADSPMKPRSNTASYDKTLAHGEEYHNEDDEEEEEEEEEEMDEETRRKLELRERMAKMSGGMGMPGMFNPLAAMSGNPPPKKRSSTKEKRSTEDSLPSSPPQPQQRVPMIPVPGMPRTTSPGAINSREARGIEEDRRKSLSSDRAAPPPPVPAERPRPTAPNVPTSSSTGVGYESDDEAQEQGMSADTPNAQTPLPSRPAAPPVPSTTTTDSAYFGSAASTQAAVHARANSSVVGDGVLASPRPPPPPPPTAVASPPHERPSAAEERGESEYEGDYDTDIASSAKRKDALKAHAREPSLDDSTTADEAPTEPAVLGYSRPPPPPPQSSRPQPRSSTEGPRAPPPPRPSVDQHRPPPPPVPPARDASTADDEGDYDPYRYTGTVRSPSAPVVLDAKPSAAPPIPPPREAQDNTEDSSDDLYSAPAPPRKSVEKQLSPPTAPEAGMAASQLPPQRTTTRKSADQGSSRGRTSFEQGSSVSAEHGGQIATDLALDESKQWWTSPDPLPPVLQERRGLDILSESEESMTSKRGGRTMVSKDIYILFLDYSQTVITARFDSRDPGEVSLEQRHEPPPAKMRQDQLETAWQRFGVKIADMAGKLGNSKKEAALGDGSPASFVYELIKSIPEALLPVGTRAYGAPVYANLANASVMQWDEIRPGDVITLRNAKFEGKYSGGLHQKYKQETGPLHVAVVHDWDGTKKKIRVWEQGREKKGGLRSESYRLGDLKSGEVRVWRVVGRDWVGWDGNN